MAAKQTTVPAAGQKRPYLAILCILLAGSLWGCLGIFNRNLSALGIAPETGLVKELHKYFDNVVSLGDCVKPGRIGDATSAAFPRGKNL